MREKNCEGMSEKADADYEIDQSDLDRLENYEQSQINRTYAENSKIEINEGRSNEKMNNIKTPENNTRFFLK